ncbi:MAG: AAA family ATPase, partial [Bdellovibrionota bacterium]
MPLTRVSSAPALATRNIAQNAPQQLRTRLAIPILFPDFTPKPSLLKKRENIESPTPFQTTGVKFAQGTFPPNTSATFEDINGQKVDNSTHFHGTVVNLHAPTIEHSKPSHSSSSAPSSPSSRKKDEFKTQKIRTCDYFIERKTDENIDFVEVIQLKIKDENGCGIVVLYGLGGSGKTTIASWFMQKFGHNYVNSLFRLDAKTRDTLSASFRQYIPIVAQNTDENFKSLQPLIKKRFSLVIIDNLDNDEMKKKVVSFISNLKKEETDCHVLITSILSNWDNEHFAKIKVEEFSEEQAKEFVCHSLELKGEKTSDPAIDELIKRTSKLPLPLAGAIGIIKEKSCGINKYIRRFDTNAETKKELLQKIAHYQEEYGTSICMTWITNMEYVRETSLTASDLLKFFAFFEDKNIPQEFLVFFTENKDKYDIEKTLGIIKDFSLINIDPISGEVSIHNLFQDVIKIDLEDKEKFHDSLIRAVQHTKLAFNYEYEKLIFDQQEKG